MGSEVPVLRELKSCARLLSIPSNGVFLKSSRDKCWSWPASAAFFKINFAFLTLKLSHWTGDIVAKV